MKKHYAVTPPGLTKKIAVSAYSEKQAKLKAFFKWAKGKGFTFKQINTMRGPWM